MQPLLYFLPESEHGVLVRNVMERRESEIELGKPPGHEHDRKRSHDEDAEAADFIPKIGRRARGASRPPKQSHRTPRVVRELISELHRERALQNLAHLCDSQLSARSFRSSFV